MNMPASLSLAWIAFMALAPLLSGCSLIGLAIDGSQAPDTLAVELPEKTLEGKDVLVTQRDGESFAGECRRVGPLPGKLYRERYARWQETTEKRAFPFSPDDTLQVAWEHGRLMFGTLEGFTHSSIVVLPIPTTGAVPQRPKRTLTIATERIDSLWTPGGPLLSGQTLQTRLAAGSIPTTDAILLRTAGSSVWVPLDDIAQIAEIRRSYQWMNTGAIADAAGLVVALVLFAAKDL